MTFELGNVAEWVAAIGTTGALFVGGRLLWIELGQARRREEEQRREAASKVSAWWEPLTVREGEPSPFNDPTPNIRASGTYWVLRVRNGGTEPVYDCRAVVLSRPRRGETADIQEFHYVHLPPEGTKTEMLDPKLDIEKRQRSPGEALVTLFFVDPVGRHWQREGWGGLKERPPVPRRMTDPPAE